MNYKESPMAMLHLQVNARDNRRNCIPMTKFEIIQGKPCFGATELSIGHTYLKDKMHRKLELLRNCREGHAKFGGICVKRTPLNEI